MRGHNVNIYFSEKNYNKIKPLITQRKISQFVNQAVEKELTQHEKQAKAGLRERLIAAHQRMAKNKQLKKELANEWNDLIVVVPMTTDNIDKVEPFEVFIKNTAETGLKEPSKIQLIYPMTIDKELRLVERRLVSKNLPKQSLVEDKEEGKYICDACLMAFYYFEKSELLSLKKSKRNTLKGYIGYHQNKFILKERKIAIFTRHIYLNRLFLYHQLGLQIYYLDSAEFTALFNLDNLIKILAHELGHAILTDTQPKTQEINGGHGKEHDKISEEIIKMIEKSDEFRELKKF
ncbi:5853_t:CDS:2 [Racocetra fulgida]|uniref:5853_t:CDS:1 n=1 Tax=Racocetra fulgida TaxID=60492 RepID=A0A9N9NAL8_9GLOM|nr:5853_t:CDS:2 [Racocetra fulgida]